MQKVQEWWRRARWLPLVLLVVAVLAPYHSMLAGRAMPIPDDVFVSDLAGGEFPLRVEAGRLLAAGESPAWTPRIFTGMPLQTDPLSLALFALLPPAWALGWLIGLLLAAAAVGAYLVARLYGASRGGAFLTGFAFAWSGFFVCQLRHLGVLEVVACFPLAIYCIEMAATGGAAGDRGAARQVAPRRRLGWLTGFAAWFGAQCLSGFPQSAYISALVYAALVALRAGWLLLPEPGGPAFRNRARPAGFLAAAAAAAVVVGALVGMSSLLPLREMAALSDRGQGGTLAWATQYNYWEPDILTFLIPYLHGDISDLSYTGRGIFWEDYGYVGLLTFLLAIMAVLRGRRSFAVLFWTAAAAVAFALVLGALTPLFSVAFHVVPGMNQFRMPTRFLFVVEFALALLGGLGLTYIERVAASRRDAARGGIWAALPLGALAAAITVADLVFHNQRQNPFVSAAEWLEPPATARTIRAAGVDGRVYAPNSSALHMAAFQAAGGWSGDLRPFFIQREFLQPDANLLYGLPVLDGYVGVAPRWCVDLIGDHNRRGVLRELCRLDGAKVEIDPTFFDWIEALAVSWVILPEGTPSGRMACAGGSGLAGLYRVPGALPRARVVSRARFVPDGAEWRRMALAGEIDPRQEIVLQDAADAAVAAALPSAAAAGAGSNAPPSARIVTDRSTEVVVEAMAPAGGLLSLADTWYPGWEATVDGRPARILRANVAHRAVTLTPGAHRVEFRFRSRTVFWGRVWTGVGVFCLLLAAGICLWRTHMAAPRDAV